MARVMFLVFLLVAVAAVLVTEAAPAPDDYYYGYGPAKYYSKYGKYGNLPYYYGYDNSDGYH